MERKPGLPAGTDARDAVGGTDRRRLQDLLLWGTGDEHITYTWRGGASPIKYGGKFEGIIPDLPPATATPRTACTCGRWKST